MEYVRTGTQVTASAVLTAINTAELFAGLYAYGSGIPLCTKILSVDTVLSTVTLTAPVTTDRTGSTLFTDLGPGVYQERCEALKDTRDIIWEYGQYVEIEVRSESQLTRDSYNSIETRSQATRYNFKAYPIDTQPSRNDLEKSGLKESADVTITTAFKDWLDAGVAFGDLDIKRMSVKIGMETYEVREKSNVSQFGNVYLYFTFGLVKR